MAREGFVKRIATMVTLGLVACLAAPAMAWNGFGHMVVAAFAYKDLTPAAKTKVAALLKLNPEYATWVAGVPAADRDRVAFVVAATWPDFIKGAPGYVNDGNVPSGPDSSKNVGYADKLQHRYWHFIDVPFSPDGTTLGQPVPPNAKTQKPSMLSRGKAMSAAPI